MTAPTGYTLKWNEEFTYPADSNPLSNPDFANKWFLSSSVCDYNLNPANVSLDGNNVVFKCTDSSNGSGILSVCTNNGAAKPNSLIFTYGYLEVRAKLGDTNQIRGIVSDIWLNGATHWPPEIDITESGSGPVNTDGGSNQMNMNLWYGTGSNSPKSVYINDANNNPVNLGKDFHIYGMEWTPTFVRYLLDDVELFSVTTLSQIPTSPMYFNSSIYPGGWWGTDFSHINFPVYMYVDYIRLYQKSATPVLSNIAISPTSANVNIGNSVQLSAKCTDQNNNPISCTLVWSSSNNSIATVNSSGLVTGISVGTANITASSGTIQSNPSNISVSTTQILTSIAISPTSANINVDSTTQLKATCNDQTGSTMTCPDMTWSSSNTSVATVNSNGLVTGIVAGSINIIASAGTIQSNVSNVTVTVTTNLVLNSGFESGSGSGSSGAPNNWGKENHGTTPSAPYTWPETGIDNIGKSVAINFPTKCSGRSSWIQNIVITGDTLYKLSGYMKLQNIVASTGYGAKIGVDWYKSSGYISSKTIITQSGAKDWPSVPYSGTITSPSGAIQAVIWLQLINASGKVYFDDIMFTKA